MTRRIEIHPDNPQARLIRQAVDVIRDGGVIVYPTDSCYALGCGIGNKTGMERIRRIRQLDDNHHFTLVCRDLSEIATYAKVDNTAYRLLKNLTPGPYTFLLKATHEVPRRLQHAKRKTIGLRVPDHAITQALLAELGEPLMSTTLQLPGDHLPLSDPYDIEERLSAHVDLILLAGSCGVEPTTVVDLVGEVPEVVRQGRGAVDWL
ncbi:SUA5/YciO/YrdC/YwlC family protein [Thioalkalivibrio sulfidiphilus HL-EbGr7]|uniref:SUA5/YciO/YrdC/YwlC family protein n=1 Tax=Thioalkalivibrio sulfidiphilus (strain HL-EbGR7) TaxID=396588 RepID=B8GT82_THISH|nr:L-threonylcarbamoyladenylate synthase [Thioalkalivibrio sulfidiphilus]ACL73097.1 SUA5/YciO/YrdC/YwlC family protein [Thioalkalivibrio sulfidiphilus HL-EbGr7]